MIGNLIMEALAAIGLILQMIILVPFFIILFLISLLIPPTVDTDINQYETYRQELNYAVDFMPALDELGQFEELRFGYQETPEFIFCPKTLSLTVRYDEATYEAMKQQMLAAYEFIDAPVIDTDGDLLLDDTFTYQEYDFQSVPMLDDMHSACEYFGLLGVNDGQRSIAWLYYDNIDRDLIATTDNDLDDQMRTIIDDEFHWKPFTE